jgi:RNA polymerase sigma-70 factor (ECF subfamily)
MAEDRTARRLAELLDKATAGDEAALNALCQELEPMLRKYFWHRFQNQDIVEELCQETFLRFLKNLPNIRDRMSLRSFVIKVAIHVTQDYFRKKYRRPEEELEAETVASAENPAEALLSNMDLKKALDQLPEQSRTILLMRADGYKYEEISAKTDLSVSGVKMQVKRNLAKLRSALDVTISVLATTLVLKWLFELVRNTPG